MPSTKYDSRQRTGTFLDLQRRRVPEGVRVLFRNGLDPAERPPIRTVVVHRGLIPGAGSEQVLPEFGRQPDPIFRFEGRCVAFIQSDRWDACIRVGPVVLESLVRLQRHLRSLPRANLSTFATRSHAVLEN